MDFFYESAFNVTTNLNNLNQINLNNLNHIEVEIYSSFIECIIYF